MNCRGLREGMMHSSIRPRWPFRQWAPSICPVVVGEEEINCLACKSASRSRLKMMIGNHRPEISSAGISSFVIKQVWGGRGEGERLHYTAPWMDELRDGWMGGWTWPPFVKPRGDRGSSYTRRPCLLWQRPLGMGDKRNQNT